MRSGTETDAGPVGVCEWQLAQIREECQTAPEQPQSGEKLHWMELLREKAGNPEKANVKRF